jgi:hypothetical protein
MTKAEPAVAQQQAPHPGTLSIIAVFPNGLPKPGAPADSVNYNWGDPPTSPWEIIDPAASGGEAMPALLLQGGEDKKLPAMGGFEGDFSSIKLSLMTTKVVPSDIAGKLSGVISRPGGATEISRWWSEA